MNTATSRYFRLIAVLSVSVMVLSFIFSELLRVNYTQAALMGLPEPGVLLRAAGDYQMPLLRGMKVNYDNPLDFQFIFDTEDENRLKDEDAKRMIDYFFAAVSVPNQTLWVNLSPYEQDRVVEESLGRTDLGKDLLGQDYILKQLSSSLTHPDTPSGRAYWGIENRESKIENGSTGISNIPARPAGRESLISTERAALSKIWITPDIECTEVQEGDGIVWIAEAKLKAQSERDYVAQKIENRESPPAERAGKIDKTPDDGLDILLPAVINEINHGKNFAQLRQIYYSMILGMWFKKRFKESFFANIIEQKKVKGIDTVDSAAKEEIYQVYKRAFENGVYNVIKKEKHPQSRKKLLRKYFSGGVVGIDNAVYEKGISGSALDDAGRTVVLKTILNAQGSSSALLSGLFKSKKDDLLSLLGIGKSDERFKELSRIDTGKIAPVIGRIRSLGEYDVFADFLKRQIATGVNSSEDLNRIADYLAQLNQLSDGALQIIAGDPGRYVSVNMRSFSMVFPDSGKQTLEQLKSDRYKNLVTADMGSLGGILASEYRYGMVDDSSFVKYVVARKYGLPDARALDNYFAPGMRDRYSDQEKEAALSARTVLEAAHYPLNKISSALGAENVLSSMEDDGLINILRSDSELFSSFERVLITLAGYGFRDPAVAARSIEAALPLNITKESVMAVLDRLITYETTLFLPGALRKGNITVEDIAYETKTDKDTLISVADEVMRRGRAVWLIDNAFNPDAGLSLQDFKNDIVTILLMNLDDMLSDRSRNAELKPKYFLLDIVKGYKNSYAINKTRPESLGVRTRINMPRFRFLSINNLDSLAGIWTSGKSRFRSRDVQKIIDNVNAVLQEDGSYNTVFTGYSDLKGIKGVSFDAYYEEIVRTLINGIDYILSQNSDFSVSKEDNIMNIAIDIVKDRFESRLKGSELKSASAVTIEQAFNLSEAIPYLSSSVEIGKPDAGPRFVLQRRVLRYLTEHPEILNTASRADVQSQTSHYEKNTVSGGRITMAVSSILIFALLFGFLSTEQYRTSGSSRVEAAGDTELEKEKRAQVIRLENMLDELEDYNISDFIMYSQVKELLRNPLNISHIGMLTDQAWQVVVIEDNHNNAYFLKFSADRLELFKTGSSSVLSRYDRIFVLLPQELKSEIASTLENIKNFYHMVKEIEQFGEEPDGRIVELLTEHYYELGSSVSVEILLDDFFKKNDGVDDDTPTGGEIPIDEILSSSVDNNKDSFSSISAEQVFNVMEESEIKTWVRQSSENFQKFEKAVSAMHAAGWRNSDEVGEYLSRQHTVRGGTPERYIEAEIKEYEMLGALLEYDKDITPDFHAAFDIAYSVGYTDLGNLFVVVLQIMGILRNLRDAGARSNNYRPLFAMVEEMRKSKGMPVSYVLEQMETYIRENSSGVSNGDMTVSSAVLSQIASDLYRKIDASQIDGGISMQNAEETLTVQKGSSAVGRMFASVDFDFKNGINYTILSMREISKEQILAMAGNG